MKVNSKGLLFGALVVLALAAAGCINPSLDGWNDYTYVYGSLRHSDGTLVQEPVTVSFGSRTVTTTSGFYTFPGIPSGAYDVEITSPNYETVRRRVIVPSGGAYQHSFTLIRDGGQAPPGDAAPAPPIQPTHVLSGKVVVVDPGHGGFNRSLGDYGAEGTYGVEKENTLAIGLYLQDLLEQAGAEVVMTRDRDVNPSIGTRFEGEPSGQLKARVDLANRIGADVFVSIHNNSNPNPEIRGIKSFYYSSNGRELAEALQAGLVQHLGALDRGTGWASFHVIRETLMPAVLLEIGFISNPTEDYLLSTENFRAGAAHGIFNGLVRYFTNSWALG